MKKTQVLILFTILLMACGKEMKACHATNFGNLRFVWKTPLTPIGDGNHQRRRSRPQDEVGDGVWKIELELLGKNDTIAFGTAFSLALLLENSASLHYISKDTLLGNRTSGTIFFPSTFKKQGLCIWWEGDKENKNSNKSDWYEEEHNHNGWWKLLENAKRFANHHNTSISHLVEAHLIYLCNKKQSVEHISPLVKAFRNHYTTGRLW